MKRRNAFSIVEVLMAVSVGTFLLTLVTVLMVRTLESHRTLRGHLRNTIVRRDLATAFHKDIHSANEVAIENDQLLIQVGAESIHYEDRQDGVARIVEEDGNIVREESYYCSNYHSLVFETNEKFGRSFLSLTIYKQANAHGPLLVAQQIVAEIGRHETP